MGQRVFTAIDLSEQNKKLIAEVQHYFSKDLQGIVRWIKQQHLHLTLKFVGDLEDQHLNLICKQLEAYLKDFKSFDLKLNSFGIFPNSINPRIIWIGINKSNPLYVLYKEIEDIFYHYQYPKEKRAFHPHLTIGRAKKNLSLEDKIKFADRVVNSEILFSTIQTVKQLTLYSSKLASSGPKYTSLLKANFKS